MGTTANTSNTANYADQYVTQQRQDLFGGTQTNGVGSIWQKPVISSFVSGLVGGNNEYHVDPGQLDQSRTAQELGAATEAIAAQRDNDQFLAQAQANQGAFLQSQREALRQQMAPLAARGVNSAVQLQAQQQQRDQAMIAQRQLLAQQQQQALRDQIAAATARRGQEQQIRAATVEDAIANQAAVSRADRANAGIQQANADRSSKGLGGIISGIAGGITGGIKV